MASVIDDINCAKARASLDETPSGRLHLDGNVIVAAVMAPSMRERRCQARLSPGRSRSAWRYRARARSSQEAVAYLAYHAIGACPMPMRCECRKTFYRRDVADCLPSGPLPPWARRRAAIEDEVEEAVRRAVCAAARPTGLWGRGGGEEARGRGHGIYDVRDVSMRIVTAQPCGCRPHPDVKAAAKSLCRTLWRNRCHRGEGLPPHLRCTGHHFVSVPNMQIELIEPLGETTVRIHKFL